MHDSCICKFTHETKLIDFMFEAYEEITGRACKGMKWDYYGIDFNIDSMNKYLRFMDKDYASICRHITNKIIFFSLDIL